MTSALTKKGSLYLLNEVPYRIAWDWQQQLVADYKHSLKYISENPVRNLLILLQHSSVYTLGHGADVRFLRFDPLESAIEVHRIERGGEVTYHCPGQLVGYPILNLHDYRLDLHWYLRQLEEVIIRTLACFDLKGERAAGLTGVWLEGRKVAAIGIKVSQWITMHGFALNVCPDLAGFEKIVPCGIEGKPVGSLAQFSPTISLAEVRMRLVEQFEQVFGMKLEQAALPAALIPFGD